MISGHDIVIRTTSPDEIAEKILELIQHEWREMVVEDADTGHEVEFSIPRFQRVPREFFAYESPAKKQLWDDRGACRENRNSMFHVLLQPQQITVVVDDPFEAISRNVIGAAQDLSRDLFLGRLEFAT